MRHNNLIPINWITSLLIYKLTQFDPSETLALKVFRKGSVHYKLA